MMKTSRKMQPKIPALFLFSLLILTSSFCKLRGQHDTSWIRHFVMDSIASMLPSGTEPCGDDAVMIIGSATHLDIYPTNRSALVRIDGDNGDILWQTRLEHNTLAEESGEFFFIKGLIRLKDGSYIVVVNTITENHDYGFAIHRIDTNGTVIWHKDYGEIGQDILANIYGVGISPDSMSFVVTARRLDISVPSSSLLMYHIDATGEIVQDLNLATNLSFYAEDSPVVMLSDSSFVVGFHNANFSLQATKLLRRYSYHGQLLHTHTAWDYGWWSDIKMHPSGDIVAISQANTGESENRHKHGMRTTMYTPNLDTIWSDVYNHYAGPLFYREFDFPGPISFDTHGNILSMGEGSAFNGVRPAHLVMYSVEGERLWIKRIGFSEDVGGFLQGITGKIAFPSGGVLFAGSNIGTGVLLARLDSSECIIGEVCDTNIFVSIDEEPGKLAFDFQVRPNPAIDQVEIFITDDQFQALIKPGLHVHDITGRRIISSALTAPRQEIKLQALPPGMYIAILESMGKPIGFRKLLKY